MKNSDTKVKKFKMSAMQKEVDKWMRQFPEGYWPFGDMMMTLMEEVGEVARELNHLHGSKKKKATEDKGDLAGEIGDVLFVLNCIATKSGISLDDAFAKTMQKKWKRDNYRFKRK